MQFLKVWGKNKRFLKILNFFFTRGPPGGILKIFASFLLGVYWECRTCTMKAIKGIKIKKNCTYWSKVTIVFVWQVFEIFQLQQTLFENISDPQIKKSTKYFAKNIEKGLKGGNLPTIARTFFNYFYA